LLQSVFAGLESHQVRINGEGFDTFDAQNLFDQFHGVSATLGEFFVVPVGFQSANGFSNSEKVGSDIGNNFGSIDVSQFFDEGIYFGVSVKAFSDGRVQAVNEFLDLVDDFLDI